ncbi:MAG: hypothetical protein ABF641_04895 [Acetobacter sp.]|uniref:hypothetical protein n=1 Tax=Acetobacter sp. TaxID=440 RepID=UPI0039E99726
MTPPANALLSAIGNFPDLPPATDAQLDLAFSTFMAEINRLYSAHVREPRSGRYLIEQIFSRTRIFKDTRAVIPYVSCHFQVGVEELRALEGKIRGPGGAPITREGLAPWKDILTEYIFDLAWAVNFLQRKVNGYVYLKGKKSTGVHSWEVFLLANQLAYHSAYSGTGPHLEIRSTQIAAIALLRQALELRFERLISVYPVDAKGKPPKLKHGFHQEFIVAHPQYFQVQGFDIADLRPIYDWCSEIVHQAYQPYAWQLSRALSEVEKLLGTRPASARWAWSIANAVCIADAAAMQTAFEDHFLEHYGHGTWQMFRSEPEALVRNWIKPQHDPSFRPVRKPSTWWGKIKFRIMKAFRRVMRAF